MDAEGRPWLVKVHPSGGNGLFKMKDNIIYNQFKASLLSQLVVKLTDKLRYCHKKEQVQEYGKKLMKLLTESRGYM
jgi:hypothetical protein